MASSGRDGCALLKRQALMAGKICDGTMALGEVGNSNIGIIMWLSAGAIGIGILHFAII